jgi:hypothetical protein
LLGACGGDDALSKSEFIAEADKLCQAFNDKFKNANPQSMEQIIALFDQAIAAAGDTQAEFEDLKPPEDGEAVHQALVSSLRDSTDKVREARDAAKAGNGEGLQNAMREAEELGSRADAEAKAYGFKVCGSEEELPDT